MSFMSAKVCEVFDKGNDRVYVTSPWMLSERICLLINYTGEKRMTYALVANVCTSCLRQYYERFCWNMC